MRKRSESHEHDQIEVDHEPDPTPASPERNWLRTDHGDLSLSWPEKPGTPERPGRIDIWLREPGSRLIQRLRATYARSGTIEDHSIVQVTDLPRGEAVPIMEQILTREAHERGVQMIQYELPRGTDSAIWRDMGYTIDDGSAVKNLERTEKQQKGDAFEHEVHQVLEADPNVITIYGGARTRGFDGAFFDPRTESIVLFDAKDYGRPENLGYVNSVSSFAEERFNTNFDKMANEIADACDQHPEHAKVIQQAFNRGRKGRGIEFLVIGADHTRMTDDKQEQNQTQFVTISEFASYLRQRGSS